MFQIRNEPLDPMEVLAAVSNDAAGAIDVFVGRVRNHDQGQSVTRLEYEAYVAMAEAELARIGAELMRASPELRVAALHRVGMLEVGDVAVVAAASAPHRAEAFAATRRLIDEIKARVPIWKRQFGPDGASWVGWEDARCQHSEGHDARGHHRHGKRGEAPRHRIVVVTLSDTRGPTDDPSGDLLASLLSGAGHDVVRRHHLRDEPDQLRRVLGEEAREVDVIVTTGGTGITRRDRTIEALEAMLELRLEGFGEALRRLSFEEVGARGLLSRAVAGTIDRCLVFCLPGSPGAVRLGTERLVIPLLEHAVAMVRS